MKKILFFISLFTISQSFAAKNIFSSGENIEAEKINENFQSFYMSGLLRYISTGDLGLVENGSYTYRPSGLIIYSKDFNPTVNSGVLCSNAEGTGNTCSGAEEQVGFWLDIPYNSTYEVCAAFTVRSNSSERYMSTKLIKRNNLNDIIEIDSDYVRTIYSSASNDSSNVNICNVYELSTGKHSFALQFAVASDTDTKSDFNLVFRGNDGSSGEFDLEDQGRIKFSVKKI